MMKTGHEEVIRQGDSLGQANQINDEIAVKNKRGDHLANELSKRDCCTKALLFILIILMGIAIVVVLVYKIGIWTK